MNPGKEYSMIKRFCDICHSHLDATNIIDDTEIGPGIVTDSTAQDKNKCIRIAGVVMDDNNDDVCKYCIIDAINKHDDRPQGMDTNE